MAKTANELLQGILTVVSRIDNKTSNEKEGGAKETSGIKDALNISSSLLKFSRVKPETTKQFVSFIDDILKVVNKSDRGKKFQQFSTGLINISNALPDLVKGLNELGRMRSKRVDASLNTLRKLYNLMYELGDARNSRRMERSIKLFEEIGKSLQKIARPMKAISNFLSYLGLSFVVFAAGIVAASALLKLASPLGVVGATLAVVGGLVAMIGILSLANRFLRPGLKAIKGIGKGFMWITAGLLGFTLSLLAISAYLGTGSGGKGIGRGMLVLGGVVLIMVGMFALLGLADKTRIISRGTRAVRRMGIGLVFLTLGILGFTLSLLLVATYLGKSKDGKGILSGLAVLGLVVVGMVGMFWLLGKAAKSIALGALTAILMSVGIGAIAYSVYYLAQTSAKIGTMLSGGKNMGKTVKLFGHEVPPVVGGLGMVGTVFVGAAILFGLLGIPAVSGIVLSGALTAAAIGGSLIVLAIAVKKLVAVSANIPMDFPTKLEAMIGGLLSGTIAGITMGLTGKREEGSSKLSSALKNTALLMGGVGVLFTVSLTLSQFAKALTAFNELNNMREIIGYDKDGKPVFGDKVNIINVSKNISTSISTFLQAIIQSTEGLTRDQAVAIRKMARALTGKRGILSGVIQFTEALKVYSQYGPEGMIGYTYFEEAGKDADGNPIYKELRGKVSIDIVASNMVNAFTSFINKLTESTEGEFGPDRRGRRQIKKMAKLLSGKNGVLSAVIDFADTLEFYAKYGKESKIPIINAEGKVTGFLTMDEIAKNIVNAITSFSKTLGDSIDKEDKKEAKQAKKTLGKFDALIKQMNKLTKAQDGMERMAGTMKELGEGIGMIAKNLGKLDTNKLGEIAKISAAYLEETNEFSNSNKRIAEKSSSSSSRQVYSSPSSMPSSSVVYQTSSAPGGKMSTQQKENWDEIAQMIGDQVGQRVSASLKNGQFVFEFDTTKAGGVYYWSPR